MPLIGNTALAIELQIEFGICRQGPVQETEKKKSIAACSLDHDILPFPFQNIEQYFTQKSCHFHFHPRTKSNSSKIAMFTRRRIKELEKQQRPLGLGGRIYIGHTYRFSEFHPFFYSLDKRVIIRRNSFMIPHHKLIKPCVFLENLHLLFYTCRRSTSTITVLGRWRTPATVAIRSDDTVSRCSNDT